MYHIKMAAHMYNIWSLAYRTHSLVFVRHSLNLLDYAFVTKTVLTCFLLCFGNLEQ